MVTLLNQLLADAIDLGLQAKQAHWNVKGSQFASLHAFFDEAADIFHDVGDQLAERAVSLGGIAQGTLQAVSTTTRLPAYAAEILDGADHLRALAVSIAPFARSSRLAIDIATGASDALTADLLTEISRSVDKLYWQLTAHLSTPR